jgi:flagellin
MTMLSINTNVGALTAAQHSYSVNKSMETSMERLSSGKRINSAADDAAGLAISTRINAEIQGLQQSIKNAADAQSVLNVAEGALTEVHTILLRMRELAVQSANDTVRDQDRDMLQTEVAQLEAEIQRISDDTTWSGMTLLASRLNQDLESGATFQIGPRDTDVITISIAAIDATQAERLNLSSHISTQAAAQDYIANIDAAISKISASRGKYGATMNRLDHAMANMANIVTNLSTSKGRIMDADFAAESANLARTQVLQQASMAMLSQANASKQNILALFN